MKKLLLLILASIGLLSTSSLFAYSTGASCSFGPQSVVGNSIFWSNVNCTINGTLYNMGSANYVGGSFGSSTCWTNSLNTANYGTTYFYSTSCSGILSSGQTGTGTASNVILSVNQQGLDRSGPAGPQGSTGATGPIGPQGATGATGPIGTFVYDSGAIRGTIDTLQASYDLPQWVFTVHLSSPASIEGAEGDVEFSDSSFYVSNSTLISDPNDPRLLLTVKSLETGTQSGVACGWYDIEILSSLLQGTMFENTNPYPIASQFEIYGCDGYKTSAPPVYMLQSPDTPFSPPSASGSYLALTYKDSTTGATYFDLGALLMLVLYVTLGMFLFYIVYNSIKKIATGKKFF